MDDHPESVCIYETTAQQACTEITDRAQITEITRFINEAIDWNKPTETLANTKVTNIDNLDVTVTYENEKAIYFDSEKGAKMMKPESEFLELLDTSKTVP